MGLCAGLGLGLVIAFLIEQKDTTFSGVDDFQRFTTIPVAAVIPNVQAADSRSSAPKNAVVSLYDPDSVAAEQYRMLALKIQQAAGEENLAVMITSAAGGEGKSMTAANLSVALAGIGEGPVLLVDADLRKPRIHEYFELSVPLCRESREHRRHRRKRAFRKRGRRLVLIQGPGAVRTLEAEL
jgi:MinD-like ATPase involved in chromosome partitioning or flagellar assembly